MGERQSRLSDSQYTPSRPATDGGSHSISLDTPVDAERLAAFLKEHDDAPAYEVTYRAGETPQSALLWEFELARGTFKRVGLTPAARCLPLDPGSEVYHVPVGALERVAITEPPPERYTTDADSPIEEARGLRRLAEGDPGKLPISKLLPVLESQETTVQRESLRALESVAGDRPGDCRPAIPRLRRMLTDEDRSGTRATVAVLRSIGEEDARAITHLGETLHQFLRSEDGRTRRDAARCIAAIAGEDPSAVVDATPILGTIIADRANGLSHAVQALTRISRDFPARVRPVATDLGELIGDESVPDGTRLNATAALGRSVEEYPSVGLGVIENLVPVLESENRRLRNNAVGLLGAIAIRHSDAVRQYTDALADAIQAPDPNTRAHATAALSRIAQDFPDAVEDLTPLLKACLADEAAQVRENACWALGYLRAEEAKERLAQTARTDDDEAVRRRASWAIDRCRSC